MTFNTATPKTRGETVFHLRRTVHGRQRGCDTLHLWNFEKCCTRSAYHLQCLRAQLHSRPEGHTPVTPLHRMVLHCGLTRNADIHRFICDLSIDSNRSILAPSLSVAQSFIEPQNPMLHYGPFPNISQTNRRIWKSEIAMKT